MENKIKSYDKILNFIFSKDYRKYLILLVILGGILRYLIVNNISFLGDEMVHGPHAINIISTNFIGTMVQSTLWFYLTDLIMKIIGVNALSTRFLSFFFGILSILALYLLTKEMFNKKTAVISSFLLAISPFVIRYTLIEMDIAMMFFILIALYFFIKELKENKLSYLAALCLGVATLIKPIAMFFVLAFGIAYFYYKYKTADNKKELLKKEDWKQGILFGLIIIIIYSPILIYNYLLYKSKGITDVYMAQYFDINKEIYSSLLGYDQGFSIINALVGSFNALKNMLLTLDPVITIFGIFGIFLVLRYKQKVYGKMIILIIIIPFFLQSGSNQLTTHYTNYIPLLAIFAAYSLESINNKFRRTYDNILTVILIIILFVNIFLIPIGNPLYQSLTSQSANIQMRNFAISGIEDNAIVISDSRIYTGRTAWMFNDKFYLDASLLGRLNEYTSKLQGKEISAPVYFIECATDDCGWGTVTNDIFNKSSEETVSFFSERAELIKTLYGGGGFNEETGEPYYKIYRTKINTNINAYEFIQNTHNWFYYPLNYQKESFDEYKVDNLFDRILDLIGHIIFYFSLVLSLLIPIYLFYLLKKDNSEVEEKDVIVPFNLKKYIPHLIGIILILATIGGYLHYTNKTIMENHCNSINLEMYKYSTGELYCLNNTDNSFRGFYYISKGLRYEITKEMQLHDQWRAGLK